MGGSRTDDGYAQSRPLPQILVVNFGHRHIEAVVQTFLKAIEHLPLVLKGLALGQKQISLADQDDQNDPPRSSVLKPHSLQSTSRFDCF